MADPSTYRPAPGEIPVDPGVYRFRDSAKRVIYVGKAKSIKKRVAGHFTKASGSRSDMVASVSNIEFVATQTEAEALLAE